MQQGGFGKLVFVDGKLTSSGNGWMDDGSGIEHRDLGVEFKGAVKDSVNSLLFDVYAWKGSRSRLDHGRAQLIGKIGASADCCLLRGLRRK